MAGEAGAAYGDVGQPVQCTLCIHSSHPQGFPPLSCGGGVCGGCDVVWKGGSEECEGCEGEGCEGAWKICGQELMVAYHTAYLTYLDLPYNTPPLDHTIPYHTTQLCLFFSFCAMLLSAMPCPSSISAPAAAQ